MADAHITIRPMSLTLLSNQTGHSHLRRLAWLRVLALLAQCATLAGAWYFLHLDLPWPPLLLTVAGLAALDLLTWWRLRFDYPVSHGELYVQLCADVLALSALLYFSGGSTNPFISLFLLPLVIAAATLPARYTWGMAALTSIAYSLLMKYYVPLPMPGMDHDMESMQHDMSGMDHNMPGMDADSIFNLHVFGMWLGYVLSAAIIAFFVVKMAQAVRQRDETLARIREETLRNERIVALGTLAAGAAHELSTPLSTMSVVIGELKHESDLSPEWQESLQLLDGQVRNCRRILDKMLANTQHAPAQTPREFLHETLEEWRLQRPLTPCSFTADGPDLDPMAFDPALAPAILNLLNNAADASPQSIEAQARWDERELTLTINDLGPGLTAEAASRAGSAFFTTKQEGRGLGLFLANATLERLGGKVSLYNREGGGATTELSFPFRPERAA